MAKLDADTVLLFYKEWEKDKYVPYDRYVRRIVKPAYNVVRRNQGVSGFRMWYQLLVQSLRSCGHRVVTNNAQLARRNPEHPVGLVGYPNVLDTWDLPNPALLGPGLYDHPMIAPHLLDDPRYRLYITTCDWIDAVFRKLYGQRCIHWHAGIDIERWADTSSARKTLDIIVYDKIRWNRDQYAPNLLEPILAQLQSRGLRYRVVRYGQYTHPIYRNLLREARALLFLCEHETQGMAYQEAMASNVPVLAWVNGYWLDPRRPTFDPDPVPATSVPFFAPECGECFSGVDDFEEVCARFLERLPMYRPREYVRRELSFQRSADLYMRAYRLAGSGETRIP